jgi:hypothetical protein
MTGEQLEAVLDAVGPALSFGHKLVMEYVAGEACSPELLEEYFLAWAEVLKVMKFPNCTIESVANCMAAADWDKEKPIDFDDLTERQSLIGSGEVC